MAYRKLLLLPLLLASLRSLSQQGGIGSIVGELQQVRGDLAGRTFVELQLRGATINNAYSDDQGKFGFYGLGSGPYHILIRDEHFRPIDELVVLDTTISPVALIRISLTPLQGGAADPMAARERGSNKAMIDPAEYQKHFPKPALKEFDKGIAADQDGDGDAAIRHYQKALGIAPDFYPAHNNLGSDYLSKANFAPARREFEEAIRLNQSDAAAYLNLSNVCMLTDKLDEAQQFLSEGIRREPDSALGQFLLGSLDMRTGKYPEAESALRRAIRTSPVMTQARLQLINLLLKLGRNEQAKSELIEFISAFPDNAYTPKAKQSLARLGNSRPQHSQR